MSDNKYLGSNTIISIIDGLVLECYLKTGKHNRWTGMVYCSVRKRLFIVILEQQEPVHIKAMQYVTLTGWIHTELSGEETVRPIREEDVLFRNAPGLTPGTDIVSQVGKG